MTTTTEVFAALCRQTFDAAWEESVALQPDAELKTRFLLAIGKVLAAASFRDPLERVEAIEWVVRWCSFRQRKTWDDTLVELCKTLMWHWKDATRCITNELALYHRLTPAVQSIQERLDAVTQLNHIGLMQDAAKSHLRSQGRLEGKQWRSNQPEFQQQMPDAIRIAGVERAQWRYDYNVKCATEWLEHRIHDLHPEWVQTATKIINPFEVPLATLDLFVDQTPKYFYSEFLQAQNELARIKLRMQSLDQPYERALQFLKDTPQPDWLALAEAAVKEYEQDLLTAAVARDEKRRSRRLAA